MKQKNHRQNFVFSLFLIFTFFINFLSTAQAQDVVTSEDFTGGSSAFVFKNSRKVTQKKVAFRTTASIKRTKTQRIETIKRVTKQTVTVAKVNPKRTKSKEVNPETIQVTSVEFKRKTPQQASVIFAGVGEYYLNRDDIDQAMEFFRESVSLDSKNQNAKNGLSDALARYGDKLLNGEKYDLAKLPYDEALKFNPNNAAVYAGYAEIYVAKDDVENAIVNYEKALSLDPELTELNAPLGVIYFQKGEVAKAETYLQKAVAANPNNAETQFYLGLLRYKQDRDAEAINAFRRSIELDPNNPETHYYLGEVYDRLDRAEDAIAEYKKAVELNPKYFEVWFDLGVAYYNRATNQGPNSVYYEEAIKAYKEAVKIKPTNGDAHANLADVYRQLNRLDEAIGEYRLATTFIKDDADLYSKFGYVAGRRATNPNFQNYWKISFENFEKAIALNAKSPDYIDYQNLGWAYYNAAQGDLRAKREADYKMKLQKSKEALQTAISLNPAPKVAAAINLNLGMTLTDLGEYQAAADTLKRATELQKDWLPAINELGIAYRKNGDFDNAAKQFRKAIEVDDNFAAAHYGLAEVEYRRGNLKEAKKEYEKLKQMNREDLAKTLEFATNGGILK